MSIPRLALVKKKFRTALALPRARTEAHPRARKTDPRLAMPSSDCESQWSLASVVLTTGVALLHGLWVAQQAEKFHRRLAGLSKQVGDLSWKVSMIGHEDEDDDDAGGCAGAAPEPAATLDVPASLAAQVDELTSDDAETSKKDD